MIRKIKINSIIFYLNSFFIFLSVLNLQVKAEAKIIAKRGDTLLKISKQYDVPLKELMYKNNFNDATEIIEGNVILIPKKNKNTSNEKISYKVVEGDTLYKIAKIFNINLKDIISLNNLSDDKYRTDNYTSKSFYKS